jgi:hypothetical protein
VVVENSERAAAYITVHEEEVLEHIDFDIP